jgi:hypothetical protein
LSHPSTNKPSRVNDRTKSNAFQSGLTEQANHLRTPSNSIRIVASHFASMAALLHNVQDHIPGASANPSSSNSMASGQTTEQEKDFVGQFADQQHPLHPEEVQQAPRNKELLQSPSGLSVHDFELVRTLGTGACCCALWASLE